VGEITILPADGDPGMVMTTRPGSLAIWVKLITYAWANNEIMTTNYWLRELFTSYVIRRGIFNGTIKPLL